MVSLFSGKSNAETACKLIALGLVRQMSYATTGSVREKSLKLIAAESIYFKTCLGSAII